MSSPIDLSLDNARALDAADPLSSLRAEFFIPPNTIYLDGNSLGLLSRSAERSLLRVLDEWKTLGVEGWTRGESPWFELAERLGARVAKLIGAAGDEVIVTNSTTVNLHQLLHTLYAPTSQRSKILGDALSFPSDAYAIHSFLRGRGFDPKTHAPAVPTRDGYTLDEEDILAALRDDVAIAILPGVVFSSGQLLDMPRITRACRDRRILIGWDLSHSIGAVGHTLDEWDADFAFWCSYKYLCAGPGATGGLYLNRRHFGKSPGLAGWFSSQKDRQFEMSRQLSPAPDAGAMQIGTPNILSMAPLDGALDLFDRAGLPNLRERSLRLTDYLMKLADEKLAPLGFKIVTPREERRRGGHVALSHEKALQICQALRGRGVVPDFRPPDIIRLAPMALNGSFEDCHRAVEQVRQIATSGEHMHISEVPPRVT